MSLKQLFQQGVGRSTPLLIVAILISASVAQADNLTALAEAVNGVVVRQGPSSQSAQVGQLGQGEQAQLLGSVPNWHRVQLASGVSGFVSKRWTRVENARGAVPTTSPLFT